MSQNGPDERWAEFHSLIGTAQTIVFSTHVEPDGDGLGSQVAMYQFLSLRGKKCRILNPSPLPDAYLFLSDLAPFEYYDRASHAHWLEHVDLAVIFDSGSYKRLAQLGEDLRRLTVPTFSLDHHPHPNPNGFVYTLHDVSACATGYLLYEYMKYATARWGGDDGLTKEIAEGLYVALMTDTGSFRFNNTSAGAHQMASELIRLGIRPYDLYQRVYESTPVERILLMADSLETVRLTGGGKLAWFTVTREMIKKVGARPEYVSGFTDVVRSIRGVEVAVMVHELTGDSCRVNFRSKGRVRIDMVARRMGGGGHPFAAGTTVQMGLEQAVEYVVSNTLRELESQMANGSAA
ncbi:MAG: bifunctional oligoribonuclease/PAP phosphatase NrnA [Candidatus Neomarinimicrobiota bacterium]